MPKDTLNIHSLKNQLLARVMRFALHCNETQKRFIKLLFLLANRKIRVIATITWLDELTGVKKIPLLAASSGMAYGPYRHGAQRQEVVPVQLPAVYAYFFQRVCIEADSSSILTSTGQVIIERPLGPNLASYIYEAGNLVSHNKQVAKVRIGRIDYIDKGIFLAGNGAANYYHWLVEILPKLIFLDLIPQEYKDHPLLISAEALNFPSFQQSLALFSQKKSITFLDPKHSYVITELIYINSANILPFNLEEGINLEAGDFFINPTTIEALRNTAVASLQTQAANPGVGRRVFLCRKGNRRNYNQDEVFSILAGFGFEKVFTEELSFPEQVALMQSAEVIAGPTGAAWSNILFCQEGTKALCWMAEEYADFSAFSTLAKISGVDMRYLTFHTGAKSSHDLYHRNYTIDGAHIREALINFDLNS
ncbi:glycosyltransferase family 61 protein [Chitinimonas sp. PSY-7]|uniref:glycosyltransferase 61 family protein n=1 Tax=Chitinimonas sp. PSY-7 TaxID=3459088 RepID=UPI0040401B19